MSNARGGRLDGLQVRVVMPKICLGEEYLSFLRMGEVEEEIKFPRPPKLFRARLRLGLPQVEAYCLGLLQAWAFRLGLLQVEASRLDLGEAEVHCLGLFRWFWLQPRLILFKEVVPFRWVVGWGSFSRNY
ncbi:hypothetical protein Salat_2625000 [Sesamum alatum]|uniref:Uncharacterized protein n=1 Tax=Sesamum alatum TaxID=300844 RepID=A0AAE1XNL1_9LAMI|nr:hypothetical protein Salat_2625000 [Sesamum alatum]